MIYFRFLYLLQGRKVGENWSPRKVGGGRCACAGRDGALSHSSQRGFLPSSYRAARKVESPGSTLCACAVGPLRSLPPRPCASSSPRCDLKKKQTMRDRTQELREKDDDSDNEEVERMALVTRPGSAKLTKSPDPTDEFFQMTRGIRETLKMLESKVKELEKNQTTILATPIPEESVKQGLQKLREEIKELAKDIRVRLKSIEPKKDEEDDNRNSFNNRMKRNQHGILSQQFLDLINKCNSIQSEYRGRNLERIRRHLQITGSAVVSDEELDEMLESGQTEVFVSNLMKDTQVTKQALNDIETRHSEILKLERSIQELHEMFLYLSTEVELQGEMIDRIEKNILDSGDYVKKGQLHLHTAQENQKKARKKKILLGICLSVVAFILIIVITVSISI